jgi:ParB-like chromosome segregation protein Spo0J
MSSIQASFDEVRQQAFREAGVSVATMDAYEAAKEAGLSDDEMDRAVTLAGMSDQQREQAKATANKQDISISQAIGVVRSKRTEKNTITELPIDSIFPSPENDKLYDPINPAAPDFLALVKSVESSGVLDSIQITLDAYIVSGHRRHAAARAAGLATVPCRQLPIRRRDDIDAFVRLLAEHNRQRVKTLAERTREEVIQVDADEAYQHLKEYRRAKSGLVRISAGSIVETLPERRRASISKAKMPMLIAAQEVISALEDHWPLSVRQVHYRIVAGGVTVLRHSNKPDSAYGNNLASYKDLCNLLARARIAGLVSWDAISDETRPFQPWSTWKEPGAFMANQTANFAKGYWRDLLQSQPNHIEIVAEKLTVRTTVERAASHYTIPTQIGRGFSDVGLRHNLAQRFTASGKEKMVVVLVGDLDPDGEGICESFKRSMRDDFGIPDNRMTAIKAGLRMDQVTEFNLPPSMQAKTTSSRFARFEERHGTDAWELEAMSPNRLADELRKTIDSVIDHDAFEYEREQEIADAQHLEGVRRAAITALAG